MIGCPAQRQSAEAVGRVHEVLVKAGAKFKSDNVYGLELENGSRVLALPSSDDSIRGLTVDAWIVADEAARLPEDLIAALRPMRARRPEARFAMLSTAWSRSDPFWTAWASDDPTWIRLQATVDSDPSLFKPEFLESERRALGEHVFKREYLGIPAGAEASPFTWELYERATNIHEPLAPPGPAFRPPPQPEAVPISNPVQAALRNGRTTMSSSLDDPAHWPIKSRSSPVTLVAPMIVRPLLSAATVPLRHDGLEFRASSNCRGGSMAVNWPTRWRQSIAVTMATLLL